MTGSGPGDGPEPAPEPGVEVIADRGRSVREVLLVSYLLVIVVVGGVGFLTVRFLTPQLFDRGLRGRNGSGGWRGGRGPGSSANPFSDATAVSDSLDRSITIAAAAAAAAGIVVALVVAWVASRALARRIEALREATARLASGDFEVRVDQPPETELADLAASINRLGASLGATQRTRARLISDLAHELRNPLTTILGSMDGLIDGVIPATPETFNSVAEEADRLRRLTEDLSLLARAREGAIDLRLEPLDLLDLAAMVAERMGPSFDLAGVDLAVSGEPATVSGDPDRLVQVLTNLVSNALTHTPPRGSVEVMVEPVPRFGGRLTVADTGSGIAADQLDLVFERYTRLDHQNPGTGIGLNIVRTLVDAHGGTIVAQSDGPGRGTTFIVDLPADRA